MIVVVFVIENIIWRFGMSEGLPYTIDLKKWENSWIGYFASRCLTMKESSGIVLQNASFFSLKRIWSGITEIVGGVHSVGLEGGYKYGVIAIATGVAGSLVIAGTSRVYDRICKSYNTDSEKSKVDSSKKE